MGMLKHSIGKRNEENNNNNNNQKATSGYDNEMPCVSQRNRTVSMGSNVLGTLPLPEKKEQRDSEAKSRTTRQCSLGSRSTRTIFTICSCSCRSDRRCRMSAISATSDFPRQLDNDVFVDSPASMRACKICCLTFGILIALLGILSGVSHFYVTFYPVDYRLNQGDIKVIQHSSYFCSHLEVKSTTTPIRLTALSRVAIAKHQVSYSMYQVVQLHPGVTWVRSFYLLGGSNITLELEADEIFDVLFFYSESQYNVWESRKEAKTYVAKETCCTNIASRCNVFTFEAPQEGHYFIVFHRNTMYASSAYIDLSLTFHRASLDFSFTVSSCLSDFDQICAIQIRFNSDDHVAVEIPRKKNSQIIPEAGKVTWQCRGRIWFYIVSFGVSYLIVVLIIVLLYYCFKQGFVHSCWRSITCTKKVKERRRLRSTSNFGCQNEASEFSPSPSIFSLHWDPSCQDHSFESNFDLENMASSRRNNSIAAITCRRCSAPILLPDQHCSRSPLQGESSSNPSSRWRDHPLRKYSSTDADRKLDITDSGISVNYSDNGTAKSTVKNTIEVGGEPFHPHLIEKRDSRAVRSYSLPSPLTTPKLKNTSRSRTKSEATEIPATEMRNNTLSSSLSMDEPLSPRKLSERARELYGTGGVRQVNIHDVILSTDERNFNERFDVVADLTSIVQH